MSTTPREISEGTSDPDPRAPIRAHALRASLDRHPSRVSQPTGCSKSMRAQQHAASRATLIGHSGGREAPLRPGQMPEPLKVVTCYVKELGAGSPALEEEYRPVCARVNTYDFGQCDVTLSKLSYQSLTFPALGGCLRLESFPVARWPSFSRAPRICRHTYAVRRAPMV